MFKMKNIALGERLLKFDRGIPSAESFGNKLGNKSYYRPLEAFNGTKFINNIEDQDI